MHRTVPSGIDPMRVHLGALLLALAFAGAPAWADSERPRASIDSGALVGSVHDGVRAFLGIPYAAAPVAERRWRKPTAPAAWTDVRDASKFAAACPQPALQNIGLMPPERSEDCLYLNVWAPAKTDARVPVMVWIHGGANRIGAGSLPYYDGSELARRGVAVVTFNYRIGYLGYFSHPALDGEGQGGNFGLLDQIQALVWVQRNIAAFGGDPKQVTVFGESAGAGAVLQLLTNDKADGLFARAIIESGGGWQQPITRHAMQDRVEQALRKIGIAGKVDAQTLRSLDAQKLIDAQSGDREMGFGPFLDETTVTASPAAVIRESRQAAVPLMIGSNTWEGSLMQSVDIGERGSRLANLPKVRELYRNEAKTDAERMQLLFGDLVFAAPARWVAANHARRASVFLYRFGYVRSARRGEVAGVAHGGEVPYVFDTLGGIAAVGLSDTDRATAAAVADCWVAFAKSGRPDCRLGTWNAYSRAGDNTFVIGNEGAAEKNHDRADILDAIEKYFGPGRR